MGEVAQAVVPVAAAAPGAAGGGEAAGAVVAEAAVVGVVTDGVDAGDPPGLVVVVVPAVTIPVADILGH